MLRGAGKGTATLQRRHGMWRAFGAHLREIPVLQDCATSPPLRPPPVLPADKPSPAETCPALRVRLCPLVAQLPYVPVLHTFRKAKCGRAGESEGSEVTKGITCGRAGESEEDKGVGQRSTSGKGLDKIGTLPWPPPEKGKRGRHGCDEGASVGGNVTLPDEFLLSRHGIPPRTQLTLRLFFVTQPRAGASPMGRTHDRQVQAQRPDRTRTPTTLGQFATSRKPSSEIRSKMLWPWVPKKWNVGCLQKGVKSSLQAAPKGWG